MLKFPVQTTLKVLEVRDISRPLNSQDSNNNNNSTLMLVITDGQQKYSALEREKLSARLNSKLLLQNVPCKNDILLLTRENTMYDHSANCSVDEEFDDFEDEILLESLDLMHYQVPMITNETMSISSLKTLMQADAREITIIADISEIPKMGLGKSGFQQYLVLKDETDTVKIKVSEDLIHIKLGIDGQTARSLRKTSPGDLVSLLSKWYDWLGQLSRYEFVLKVGNGQVEWSIIDGVIIRDFAYTDDRHYGIYPTLESANDEISLPIHGQDLSLILVHLSSDLSNILQKSVVLSTFIANHDHSPQSEEDMEVQAGQELVMVQHGNATTNLGKDRWASMDDDIEQDLILEIKYEPEFRDIAATIKEFESRRLSRSDRILCLKINANGHLLGVGDNIRGKVKVELEDIGLIPLQK